MRCVRRFRGRTFARKGGERVLKSVIVNCAALESVQILPELGNGFWSLMRVGSSTVSGVGEKLIEF